MSSVGSGAAVSAFTGRASSIGGLSVPPSWATPLAVRQIAAAFPGTAPIIMQNSQTTADSPYTGMALASVVGTSMAGLASRGAPAASAAATTPAANKGPAATVVAANRPARSSGARGDAGGAQRGVPLDGPGRDLSGGHTCGRQRPTSRRP